MRQTLCLLLILLLTSCLLAGCEKEDTAPVTVPTLAEAQPATEGPEETTVPETTETYPEAQVNSVVLMEGIPELTQDYILMAVSQEGPFLAQNVELNEKGADALIQWLMGEDSREIAADFGKDTYGEPVFSLPAEEILYTGRIAKARENSAVIHLALDESLASTGLLDELIPVFEAEYGYTVEIQTASALSALNTARNGYADLVLVKAGEDAWVLADDGFIRTATGFSEPLMHFIGMSYLLCGPMDDPAGVKTCATAKAAFVAIAKTQSTFISRGDGSFVHTLEQEFWPRNTEFGDWYISADMDMGPCLVMNDIQGGYVLTDKLTWLIFAQENGII